ncbi:MAG: ATP-dependent zinc metalloprotease FtsH [Sphingomonadales bacterium]
MIWLAIPLFLLMVWTVLNDSGGANNPDPLAYSDFLREVENGNISEVTIEGNSIAGKRNDQSTFVTTKAEEHPELITRLSENNIKFTIIEEKPGFWSYVGTFLPFLLLIAVWIFFMNRMQGGGGRGAMSFGRSRARLLNETQGKVTFDDVAGIEEAKEEVEEIVEFLKEPRKFQRLGGKIPKGALLVGAPGTGKTLLARAIAGEADVPFFNISGSDFVEMFVGVGASRVRDMFEQAKKHAPCIIFIDEIDAVGRHRGAGLGGGNDEREQTLNQLLVEMDGFETNEGIILIAATNRPDVLDPALLRPGRFDRQVVVPLPDIIGREKILEVHIKKVPLAPDFNPRIIARGTPGFSGADLANLVNEAALLAARKGKRLVSAAEFEEAKDKVMMGAERRSMVMSEDERKLTAFHEAGHALVAYYCPASDPIHKATIIPRGRALGMVMRLPERDQYSISREKMHDNLTIAMGGRVAEEEVFGYDKVTSGASSDFQSATNLARAMVTRYGMSDKLGPLQYLEEDEEVFLGHSVTRHQNISQETSKLIDSEIKRFVVEAHKRAQKIIKTHRKKLDKIGNALLEYETLTGKDIEALIKNKKIDRTPAVTEDDVKAKKKVKGSVPAAGAKKSKPKDYGGEPQPQS